MDLEKILGVNIRGAGSELVFSVRPSVPWNPHPLPLVNFPCHDVYLPFIMLLH